MSLFNTRVYQYDQSLVFLPPPWFFYELLILAADGVPVRVRLEPPAFDLDLDALEAVITPRAAVSSLSRRRAIRRSCTTSTITCGSTS